MYIAFFCFFIFVIRANSIRKEKGHNLAFFLYALFALSFISSFLMGLVIPNYCANIKFLPTVYLLLILFIWFEAFDKRFAVNTKDQRNKVLAKIMLVVMIPSFLFYLYYLWGIFTSGLFFLDDNVRTILSIDKVIPNNTINTIAGWSSALYFINIYLFFIGVIEKWGWKYNSTLLISSLSFPTYCLCYFGRDGIVYWILNFIILYAIFYNHFSQKTRKNLSRLIVILTSISSFMIVIISINRFFNEDSDAVRSWGGTLGYMGQQLGNFSDVFYVNFHYSSTLFPGWHVYFDRLLEIDKQASSSGILEGLGMEEEMNVFRFYVYTLLTAYGYIGGLLVSIIFYLIIRSLYRNDVHSISNLYLIIILIIYQIPMNGVFYYRQAVSRGDVAYVLGILMLLYVYKHLPVPQRNH